MSRQLDTIKLNHWLNVRKMALDVFNNLLVKRTKHRIELDNLENIDDYTVNEIAKILDVPKDYIIYNEEVPPYIFNSKEQIESTKRPIIRDGIHFYNYYTLPSPKGYVAPVLIDILCPKEKLPKLNNGHLEPAITVSLGPNDIYARFAKNK